LSVGEGAHGADQQERAPSFHGSGIVLRAGSLELLNKAVLSVEAKRASSRRNQAGVA